MKTEAERLQNRLTDKALLKEIKAGDDLYNSAKYIEAINQYENVLEKLEFSYQFDICELYRKMGNCYYVMKDNDNAISMYEKTLEYCTTNHSIYSILAFLYYFIDNDTSLKYYKKALDYKPDDEIPFSGKQLSVLKSDRFSQKRIKETFEKDLKALKEIWMKDKKPYTHSKPDKNKVLNIGYLSSDFYTHAMMCFVLPLLEAHNTKKYKFTLYSTNSNYDFTTEQIQNLDMTYKNCAPLSNDQLAKLIYDDKIDILIDLGGYTHCRSFALLLKPAPIQVQYLGFVNTLGMEEVDYILADKYTIPKDIAQYYTEKPLYVDTCMNRFQLDVAKKSVPDIDDLPYHKNGYITFGSFNCASKINNFTISLWVKILDKVPNSKLLIYRTQLTDKAIDNLKTKFLNSGVDIDRVIFNNVPFPSHFNAYQQADIALDTIPFNGLTVSLELITMGIPVLTYIGESMQSRGCARINKALKLDELIAKNEDEYVKKAYKLALNIKKLEKYRKTLRDRLLNSFLIKDTKGFANAVEKAYEKAWIEYCKNYK